MNGSAGPGSDDHGGGERPATRAATQSELRELVVDASTTLISANPDELDTKLVWTLGSLASGLGFDRAAVFAADDDRVVRDAPADGGTPSESTGGAASDGNGTDGDAASRGAAFRRTHDWAAAADPWGSERPDPDGRLGRLLASVERGDPVSTTDDDPEDGGPATVLAVPIVRDWRLWGALCLAVDRPREEPTQGELSLVTAAADMVAHSMARVDRERRLAAQNERLEEFASVVSHDLRNPLNVMLAATELAEETGDPEYFETARRAVDRMDGIIDSVLELSRAGEDIGETAPVYVGEVARRAWGSVASGDAELVVDAPGTLPADESRLTDALSNLFRNAVEHGGDGVTVTVGGREGDGRTEERDPDGFYVADDGRGLPSNPNDLFERGRTGGDGGTGLGLTIVERVVEAHGWSVEAGESGAGGARFDVIVE